MKRSIFFILFLFSLIYISFISAYSWNSTLSNGLVAYYNFSEGTGNTTKDATGQQTNGTLINNIVWTSGKIGNGISFNSTAGQVMKVFPLKQNFTATTPVSFSFWWIGNSAVNPGGLLIGVNNQVTSWVGSVNGFNIHPVDTGSGMSYWIMHGAWGLKGAQGPSGNKNFYVSNTWTHYTYVYNGTLGGTSTYNWDIYKNGVHFSPPDETYSWTGTGTPSYIADSFTVGSFWGSAVAGTFKHLGNFSEVGLWNRTLSASEVLQLYNNGAGITWIDTTIDIINPNVNLTYPLNISYTINVSTLNYSYYDANPGFCWYSNSSGIWNSTTINPAGTNFTNVITKEGSNIFTVYCNDTSNNTNSSSITFIKDTILPNFINLRNFTVYANNSFSQSINATDSSGISSYWLNQTDYFNININSGLISNITNLSRIEIHYLNISVNDTVGNINSGIFYINITKVQVIISQNRIFLISPSFNNTVPYIKLGKKLKFY